MKWNDIKAVLRLIGILLVAEGVLMGFCLVPAVHFADGTVRGTKGDREAPGANT